MNVDSTLSEKFDKILRLMDKASTEGEAQAAAAAFQRLLLKHGVDEMEARRAADSIGPKEEMTMRVVVVAPARSKDTNWKNRLLHTLAKYSLCKAINKGSGTQNEVYVVGFPTEMAALIQFFDRTAAAFDRLSRESVEAMRRDAEWFGEKPAHAASWRNSFLLGAVSGLFDKLRIERQGLQNEEGVNALVVVRDAELDDATKRMFGRTTVRRQANRYADAEAYQRGYQTGRNYQDGKELGAGRTALPA